MMKTEMVVPTVEMKMQVVTCHLSTMDPIATQPKTEATLKRMTVSALRVPDAPMLRAYVGRYIEGRKNPRASIVLHA